jgi:glycosyltransferase involved in cell wall biosynthesis
MQDILSESFLEGRELPEVGVLLATFNGGLYLQEFLTSLVSQIGVRIHLFVSDDGSTDNTIQILKNYEGSFASFQLVDGPRNGPAANFFFLIQQSSTEYVALADQDDIWYSSHLISSISRLSTSPQEASLTFSSVSEFGDLIRKQSVWPNRFPGEDIRSIVTENLSRGCTFVMNSKAIQLINLHMPKAAIMHDWWILLLMFSCGNVSWGKSPELNYRIHESNSIGRSPRLFIRCKRLKKNFSRKNWPVIEQSKELLDVYGWTMNGQVRFQLASFLDDLSSSRLTGRWNLVFWKNRYRSSILDEVIVRLLLLLHKVFK